MIQSTPDAIQKVELVPCDAGTAAFFYVKESIYLSLERIASAEGKTVAQYLHDGILHQVKKMNAGTTAPGALTLQPWQSCISSPMQSTAMPYSPARRYGAPADGMRERLRQMVAVKRQIELELIDFAERELMRE